MMRLLILTQKADKDDPVLGFFHSWICEFAKRCESIVVVCLGSGKYDVPENVKILSLGKEKGASRLEYLFRFFQYIWRERKNYDAVFVHMNEEYVLLGGVFWRLLGKKIWLWRNHPMGSFRTRVAVFLSDNVFCTSPHSFTARFKKTRLMPAGIDTEFFKKNPSSEKRPNSVLFLGRISKIKYPLVFVSALHLLKEKGVSFRATIVGDARPEESALMEELRQKIAEHGLSESVELCPAVPNVQTAALYNSHEIYVNLTPTGSMDKTILEAMACEALVAVVNKTFSKELPPEFLCEENDVASLAEKIEAALKLSKEEKDSFGRKNREYASRHGLKLLADKLFQE